ncbi:hypothetical protein SEPCBS57363_001205 [Sporothrix epigloea]|uniref:AB hydrolase-1 domain-containing protein n=1 Tax=Sporothrix epigloea TaxID=1892477 RepID=A0ABP0D8Z7_9PEZI
MNAHCHIIKDFTFSDGTFLPSVAVAYEVLNPTLEKTALVITCFRGRLHNTCTFAQGALQGHRIVVAALLGNGESSSPSNTAGFPQDTVSYEDCVRVQNDLLHNALHISFLDVVIGFSMGGQATYYWLMMYPDMVRRAVIICSSASTSDHNIQFLEGPRYALQNSIDYTPIAVRRKTDAALPNEHCVRGIQAFGKAYSAWLTSAEWFDEGGFNTLGFNSRADWDKAVTGPNYGGWDPDDLLAMLGMWQRGNVSTLYGSGCTTEALSEALGSINVPLLLMPSRTDQYFRSHISEREASRITHAVLKIIPSIWGHLAGSGTNPIDTKWMDTQISRFLTE